jgi:hypothetical protein
MASIIERIARKLSGCKAREIFPGASNSFETQIIAFDENVPPPRRLIELSMVAVRTALDEIDLSEIACRATAPAWYPIWPGEHYRLLAALVKVMRPTTVVEVGTDTGLSALTIKRHLPADGRLVTFDLRAWRTVEDPTLTEADFADGRLEQRLVNLADPVAFAANRKLIASAELFFIDGPKDVTFEVEFTKHLATVEFARPPILLFDDTRLPSMLKFWRELRYPKLDLTSFGHWSGTGIVELVRTAAAGGGGHGARSGDLVGEVAAG